MAKKKLKITLITVSLILSYKIFGLPEGGNVVAGNANIQQPNDTTLLINQSTDKAIINWNQFNIASGELTQFIVPGSTSVTLNRVLSAMPSEIFGALKSNGQLWLINPNGVIFGPGSQVNVAGLVASTMNIQNEDFMKGNYQLQGNANSSAQIINQGSIVAGNNGIIALLAPQVQNQGILSANLGTVAIGTGDRVSINLEGNQLLNFTVDQGIIGDFYDSDGQRIASISNTGKIFADGGSVLLTAKNIEQVLNQSINTSGVIQANSQNMQDGKIVLLGAGDTLVSGQGQINAQGLNAGETGGTVDILGNRVGLLDQASINTSGVAGGGAVRIGGDYQGANPNIQNAIQTYISPQATINANATQNGNGGRVIVWSDQGTQFYGSIYSQGGALGGNGGLVETSGKQYLDAQGNVNTLAPNGQVGTWLLDPADLTISNAAQNNATTNSPFMPSGTLTSSNLNTATLLSALQTSNVIVQTGTDAGTGSGNITITSPINYNSSSSNSLTLNAYNNIAVNTTISDTGSTGALTLIMNTGQNGGTGGVITMSTGASINVQGGVTLNQPNAGVLALGNITSGALTITANGAISQNASTSLTVSGTTSVNSGTNNNITLTSTGNQFGSSTSPGVVIVGSGTATTGAVSINAGSFGIQIQQAPNTTTPGAAPFALSSLTLTTTGNGSITQDTNTANNNQLVVTGTTILNTGTSINTAGNVTLTNANNAFTGNILGGTLGAFSLTNTLATGLGGSGGNVGMASGNIVSGGAVTIAKVSGVVSNGAFSVDTSGAAGGGAPINQVGAFTLVGPVTLNAGSSTISLTGGNNQFGSPGSPGVVIVGSPTGAAGAVSITAVNFGIQIQQAVNTVTPGAAPFPLASLTIVTGVTSGSVRDITQDTNPANNNQLVVTGATALVAGSGGNITLTNPNNSFGTGTSALNISSVNNVSINDLNALNLGGIAISGNLALTVGGALTQNATISIGGTTNINAGNNSITLNRAGNNFGNSIVTLTGGAISIADSSNATGLQLGAVNASGLTVTSARNLTLGAGGTTTSVSGALSATANSGAAANTGILTISGPISAGTNTVSLTNSSTSASLSGVTALSIGGNIASGILNLIVNAGNINQSSGTISASGTTTANAGTGSVSLGSITNAFTTVVVGKSATVAGATTLGANSSGLQIQQAGTGISSLNITTNNGAITQANALNISGATSLNAGTSTITLNNNSNVFGGIVTVGPSSNISGAVILNTGSGGLTIAQTSGGNLGSLAITTANGAVNTSSALTVAGTTTINAGTNSITLNNANNNFIGTVSTTGSNVSVVNNNTLNLGNINASNTFTASSNNNNINQAISTAITAATTSLNSGSGNITLTNTGNSFGNVSASGNNVSLVTNSNLNINSISAAGNVLLRAINGTLTFNNNGLPINLTGTGTQTAILQANQFVNNYAGGTSPINVGTGTNSQWLFYLTNLAGNTFGSGANALVSGNQAIWGTSYPTTVTATGNRYIFGTAETLTATPLSTPFAVSKNYGDVAIFPNPTSSGSSANLQLSGFVNASAFGNVFTQDTSANVTINGLSYTSTGAITTAPVSGTPYTILLTGTGTTANGYTLTYNNASTFGNLTVNARPISISVTGTSVYGDTISTLANNTGGNNFTVTGGLVGSDTIGSVVIGTTGLSSTTDVGTYGTTASNAIFSNGSASNYSISYTANASGYTITARPITLIASASSVYGDMLPSSTASFSIASGNLVNGDTISAVTGLSSGETQLSNVGTYNDLSGSGASFSAGSANNYAVTVTNTGTLTITPAPLTITANDASREVNNPNPTFTATYTGLKNNDTPSVVSGLTITTTATQTSPVGEYPIVPANGSAQNYTITYVNGVLSIILTPPPPPNPMASNLSPGLDPALNANTIEATIEASKILPNPYHPNKKKKKVYDDGTDDASAKAAAQGQ